MASSHSKLTPILHLLSVFFWSIDCVLHVFWSMKNLWFLDLLNLKNACRPSLVSALSFYCFLILFLFPQWNGDQIYCYSYFNAAQLHKNVQQSPPGKLQAARGRNEESGRRRETQDCCFTCSLKSTSMQDPIWDSNTKQSKWLQRLFFVNIWRKKECIFTGVNGISDL